MNCLSQLSNGIFATEEQLESLKKKKNAKILVISDSHGDATVVGDIFKKFGPNCDAAVFAGDGIYDLISLMEKAVKYNEPKEWLPPVIAFARGNNDPSSASSSFCRKIIVPKRVILEMKKAYIIPLSHWKWLQKRKMQMLLFTDIRIFRQNTCTLFIL